MLANSTCLQTGDDFQQKGVHSHQESPSDSHSDQIQNASSETEITPIKKNSRSENNNHNYARFCVAEYSQINVLCFVDLSVSEPAIQRCVVDDHGIFHVVALINIHGKLNRACFINTILFATYSVRTNGHYRIGAASCDTESPSFVWPSVGINFSLNIIN